MARRRPSAFFFILLAFGAFVLAFHFARLEWFFGPARAPQLDVNKILGVTAPTLTVPLLAVAPAPVHRKTNLDLILPADLPANRRGVAEHYLQPLLELEEREGRDNALIHYVLAACVAPPLPSPEQQRTINIALRGSSVDEFGRFVPYLESWKPALAQIREGVALDYAREPGGDTSTRNAFNTLLSDESFLVGLHRPTPPGTMVFGNVLHLEALYLESRGRAREALDDYLAALTMARDFTSSGTGLYGLGEGYRCARSPLREICRMADSGLLENADVRRAMNRLRRIEETLGTTANALEIDVARQVEEFRALAETPGALGKRIKQEIERELGRELTRNPWDALAGLVYDREHLLTEMKLRAEARHTERIPSDMAALYAAARRSVSAVPYEGGGRSGWKGYGEFEAQQGASYPLLRMGLFFPNLPNFSGSRAAELGFQSDLRKTRIALALALWKAEHGEYPDTLARLEPAYFPQGLPLDPYSDKPFVYSSDRVRDMFPNPQDVLSQSAYALKNASDLLGESIRESIRESKSGH